MVYFVFDLDSTLADISPVYFYLELLAQLEKISHHMGMIAYKHFLASILEREANLRNPLYILRPRILDIFIDIKGLIQTKRCEGVIIYSNNGYLPCLEFIRDLIHGFLETDNIICTSVFLKDKDRKDTPEKTWRDLKGILVDRCGADPSLDPESVVFFDDLPDHKLRNQLPPQNYILVEAYNYTRTDESIAYIKQAFLSALEASGIMNQPTIYSNYRQSVRSLFKITNMNSKNNILTKVLAFIDADSKKIPERTEKPVLEDGNIMDVINRYYNQYNQYNQYINQTPSHLLPPQGISNTILGQTQTGNDKFGGYRYSNGTIHQYTKHKRNKTVRKIRYKHKSKTYSRRV